MENPYSPPLETDISAAAAESAEDIRKAHLKTEASIKSIGTLMLISSIIIIVASIPTVIGVSDGSLELSLPSVWLQLLVLLPVSIFQIFVGLAVRKLKPWSRIPTLCISVLSLINLPIGTVIGAYILYLLLSKKGKMVFSDGYQAVILETPHIKYKTSIVVKIVVGLFLLVVLLGLAAAFFSPSR